MAVTARPGVNLAPITKLSGGTSSVTVLVSLFVFVAAAGCTPARMAVPKDIGSASDEIVISERSGMSGMLADESFKIGAYQVTDVNRKWTSSSGSSIAGFSSDSTTGGYSFGLKQPQGKMDK